MSGIMERYDALGKAIKLSSRDVPEEYSTATAMFQGMADALAANFAGDVPAHGVLGAIGLEEEGEWVNDRAFRRPFRGTAYVALDVPVDEDGETLTGVRLEFAVEGYAYEYADAFRMHEAEAESLCGFEYEGSRPA